ncbi:MAG: hypothetical protein ACRC2R_04620 [Xenococcaceae cyanobacterium]
MNQPTSWQRSSVETFFQHFHWQGSSVSDSSQLQIEPVSDRAVPWQCLTVDRFFRKCNWQGLPQSELETGQGQFVNASTSVLLLSVRDFFRSLDWDGNPKIGALPELTSPGIDLPPSAKTPTLETLNELF